MDGGGCLWKRLSFLGSGATAAAEEEEEVGLYVRVFASLLSTLRVFVPNNRLLNQDIIHKKLI
jgi:hypothetical protein